jgi:hypothetical protein
MKKFHRFRRIGSSQVFGCAVENPKMVRTAAVFVERHSNGLV